MTKGPRNVDDLSSGLPPQVEYADLNAKQKEIFNFQKVAALLADHGFNCIKLADDWQGADFLAYHFAGDTTLKVQLKGRANIDKKYLGRGLHMAFPAAGDWYVVEHDTLVDLCGEHTNWLNTASWKEKGGYSVASPSATLLDALEPFRLGPS